VGWVSSLTRGKRVGRDTLTVCGREDRSTFSDRPLERGRVSPVVDGNEDVHLDQSNTDAAMTTTLLGARIGASLRLDVFGSYTRGEDRFKDRASSPYASKSRSDPASLGDVRVMVPRGRATPGPSAVWC